MLKLQIIRKRIPFFAQWAKIKKPFTSEKHYLAGNSICYDVVSGVEYANHIESSGFLCAAIISYGCDENNELRMMRHVTFPTLRLYPNKTHNSLDHNFSGVNFKINGKEISEKAEKFIFDGFINIFTTAENVKIKRTIFAARNSRACIEIVEFKNTGKEKIKIDSINSKPVFVSKAIYGDNNASYQLCTSVDNEHLELNENESGIIQISYYAQEKNEQLKINCISEKEARQDFIDEIADTYIIETPNENINVMAYYAKIRACESIFKTKAGLMHSPGGGGYYAALWTNDQCEYVNPLFAYLGYDTGVNQSLNCYEMYQKYISSDKALITSIISQGDGIWHGAKDRGDSAMYAYGCSRFLLSIGDKKVAEKYIDSIRDCIKYTLSQMNSDGVIKSDSDELENRFESGSANLCTSCLAYDALISLSYLEREFGNSEKADNYIDEAEKLKESIEKYFGKTVEGYETYMYCKEETKLRSWISIPLAVGIDARVENTAKALLSPYLLKNEGLITRSGEKTFWDRSTLYAIRGLFYSGQQEKVIDLFETYSKARLLGEHIPYAVEAFPEGNQAQLSAESGLYLRIFSEGILGYRPVSFNSFEIKPNLPEKWDSFSIKNILLCGKKVDISVIKTKDDYDINYSYNGKENHIKGKSNLITLS